MNIRKLAVSTATILLLTTSISFAEPINAGLELKNTEIHEDCQKHKHGLKKDPIKHLEEKKADIQKQLKEGKITKEKADEIIGKIDKRISDIKEFQKLTLDQKKEKIVKDFKAHLSGMVKEGKMTQEEADKMLKEVTEKIKNWDGTGYPMFRDKQRK